MNLARTKSAFRDGAAMAAAMGVAGLANYIVLAFSFLVSKLLKRPALMGMPLALSIEPTTSCNLRCPECVSGTRAFTRKTGMLDRDTFAHFAKSARPHAFYMNLYFQGEPFLNPDFFDMVQTARTLGYYTSTSTNGHYLSEANCQKIIAAGLDRLTVSIDGTTEAVYRTYRVGGSLQKVLTGLETLQRVKKAHKDAGPFVIFQFIVFGHNEHQIADARALAAKYGVDAFVLKTAQINNLKDGAELVPKDPKRSRYQVADNGQVVLQNSLENHCWRMWSSLVVSWDGLVLPCCFDKDAKNAVGNLTQHSLKHVWQSDKYQAFRRQLFADRNGIDICQNCTEGHEVFVS